MPPPILLNNCGSLTDPPFFLQRFKSASFYPLQFGPFIHLMDHILNPQLIADAIVHIVIKGFRGLLGIRQASVLDWKWGETKPTKAVWSSLCHMYAVQPSTIRRMRQRITAASARTHPSPGIHACKRRSARVPRSVGLEHLSRTRRRDWRQAIGAW